MAKTRREPTVSAAARRLLAFAGNATTIDDAAQIIISRLMEGITCPPTDLDAMAARVGVMEISPDKLSISGELQRIKGGFRIAYASSLNLPRRRFTIAHEIGHAILELTGRNCPRTGQEVERICDILASEILMPNEVFSREARGEPSAEKIIELAETFKASLSAICIRYAKLKSVSIFRAVNGEINWRTGLVRYDPVDVEGSELKSIVSNSVNTGAGTETIWLNTRSWTGRWLVSWAPLGQQRFILASPLYEAAKRSLVT